MKKGHRTPEGVTVQVKGKNTTITPGLHAQVVHKMGKLDRYLDRLATIEVELCTEKTREADRQNRVEATAHVAGRTIRVTAQGIDMHAAVDEAVDKLYRQLNRTKERLKSHHSDRFADTLGLEQDEQPVDDVPPPVIHVERLNVKPKFDDEAIEEMDAQGRDFFVFLNARNEQVNVVYRREDGTYGLIEPHL